MCFMHRKQVRAEEATLDASVPEANLTFQHLSRASQLPFKDKVDWFNKQCDLLRVPWDVEHQHLKVCPQVMYVFEMWVSHAARAHRPPVGVLGPELDPFLRPLPSGGFVATHCRLLSARRRSEDFSGGQSADDGDM